MVESMKISYDWLREYIDIDLPPADLAEILTSIGLETGSVEMVQTVKGGMEGLVVGEVLTCTAHTNSDHLRVTTVEVGGPTPLQIVCGAPNVAAGQKVVVATPGTRLYRGEETFTIKRSKIRGVASEGMICAEDEIGVGECHEGIIVLPAEVPVGTLAKDYYRVQTDWVFEIDITPNRSDAISHYGVARDLAAYFSIRDKDVRLRLPSVDHFRVDEPQSPVSVKVDAPQACPRYSSVVISGVKVAASPAWLQHRLRSVGIRPVNNVVDAANYVMLELGQPLHTFDAAKITGGQVRVRHLPSGTVITTLDGVQRVLSADDLVICDGSEPMCLAGVFGGKESGITEETQDVFVESAYFHPVGIRKTARRHGLSTDASFRYERGCDPSNTLYVLKRTALLIKQLAGGRVCGEVTDIYPEPVAPHKVQVCLDKIYKLIGKDVGHQTVERLFAALQMQVVEKNTAGSYTLEVPPYRVDVSRPADVAEELLRLYGYNNIETDSSLRTTLSTSSRGDSTRLQRIVSEQLSSQGFNEIMNNSLTKSAYYTPLQSLPEWRCVRIVNPLSSELNVMRQTLLFGGLESIARNVHHRRSDLKFYEFGSCYFHHPDRADGSSGSVAYTEEPRLALWLTGNKQAPSWAVPTLPTTVFELKAYVENVLLRLGCPPQQLLFHEQPDELLGRALNLCDHSGQSLAVIGSVKAQLLEKMDIEAEVHYAELRWNYLTDCAARHKTRFRRVAKYPEVRRDLALLLDEQVSMSQVEKIARESERKLLKDLYLFDVYEGEHIEKGKKSYAVSFVLQDADKTLTDKQIDATMKKIASNLETKLGAKLR